MGRHTFILTEENKCKVLNNILKMINDAISKNYNYIIFDWVKYNQNVINFLLENINSNNYKIKSFFLISSQDVLVKRLEKDLKNGARQDSNIINNSLKGLNYTIILTV